jgi:hypothetical protein
MYCYGPPGPSVQGKRAPADQIAVVIHDAYAYVVVQHAHAGAGEHELAQLRVAEQDAPGHAARLGVSAEPPQQQEHGHEAGYERYAGDYVQHHGSSSFMRR